jgi:large subunit ribosomal protein L1
MRKDVLQALKNLRQEKKRNFSQTIDLVINVKDLDLKKAENHIDAFISLPHGFKKRKICAFVGPESLEDAKSSCDKAILKNDFPRYAKDKKLTKKLVKEFDFFIAQADVMVNVASAFGKVLGPKGKMPNPKAGAVFPPKAPISSVCDKLQRMAHLKIKTALTAHLAIGTESMQDEQIADNIMSVYDYLIHHLPNEEQNIKSVFLKLTMSKPVRVK